MKNFLFFIFFFHSINLRAQIVFEYVSKNNSPITFTYGYREIGNEFTTLNNKNLILKISTSKPITIISNDIQHQTFIYAEPNDTIKINIGNNGLIEYSSQNFYRGNESKLINKIYKDYGPIIRRVAKDRWMRSLNDSDALNESFSREDFSNEEKIVTDAFLANEISSGFYKHFKLIFYSLDKLNKLTKSNDIQFDSLFNKYKIEIEKFDDEAIHVPEFRSLVQYLSFRRIRKFNTLNKLEDKLMLISTLFTNQNVIDYLLYRQINLEISNTVILDKKVLSLFNELCKNIIFKKNIADELNNNFKIPESSTLQTLVKSYIGKVVYIDFWASWCKPCLEEMPNYNELKLQYPQVEFLFVSIDQSVVSWKKATQNFKHIMDYKNSTLLAEGLKSEIAKSINLTLIPRYCLIDKNGKLRLADAPRPSDNTLKLKLNELTNEVVNK